MSGELYREVTIKVPRNAFRVDWFAPTGVGESGYCQSGSILLETPEPGDVFEGREFYELMQTYRHAPIHEVANVVAAFEAVKNFIRGLK